MLILLPRLSIMPEGSGLQNLILRSVYKTGSAMGQFNRHLMLINPAIIMQWEFYARPVCGTLESQKFNGTQCDPIDIGMR